MVDINSKHGIMVVGMVLLSICYMFSRPPSLLNQDLSTVELNNLAKYTSAGYDISPETIAAKHRFDVRLLAKGCWRSLLAPNWDPANHVVSHLALNVSTFFFGFNRVAYRLPNYLAGLLTALLLLFLLRSVSGSLCFATLGAIVFTLSPYVIDRTLVTRGYAINLLLCTIHLLLLETLVSRRASIWIHLSFGFVAGIMSINLISAPFFWNAAVYGTYGISLAFHLFEPAQREEDRFSLVMIRDRIRQFITSPECRHLISGLVVYFAIFG